MCNQSVGLISSVIERAGITTVSLSLLREVTENVKPPRALYVPFAFGYPLGEPDHAEMQHRIIRAALDMLGEPATSPILRDYVP